MNTAAWTEFNWQRVRWASLAQFAEEQPRAKKILAPLLDHWADEVTEEFIWIGLDPIDEDVLPGLHHELSVAMRNARELGWSEFPEADADKDAPDVEDVRTFGREGEQLDKELREFANDVQEAVTPDVSPARVIVAGGLFSLLVYGLYKHVTRVL